MKKQRKIVLAYSGGLDTSIILKWLQENYNAEVIAYTADIGQKINKKKIINNAKKLGIKKIIIENLKDIFVKDYVFPMIRGHAVYEGVYLLGTSIARPLIAKNKLTLQKNLTHTQFLMAQQVKEMIKLDLNLHIIILGQKLKLLLRGEFGNYIQEQI